MPICLYNFYNNIVEVNVSRSYSLNIVYGHILHLSYGSIVLIGCYIGLHFNVILYLHAQKTYFSNVTVRCGYNLCSML